MDYYIYYVIFNITSVFIIYKSIKTILYGSLVFNRKIEIFSYILYFFILSTVYIVFTIPILNVLTGAICIFLVQFNYKTTIKNKILLTLYIEVVAFLVDILSVMLVNKSILDNIYTKGKYGSILTWVLTIILLAISLKSIKNFNKMKFNFKMPIIFFFPLIIIPFISMLLISLILNDKSYSTKSLVFTSATLIIINVLIFILYDFFMQYAKNKLDKELLEKEKEFNFKQFNIIKKSYDNLDIFKHDFKNHLSYIKACAINNNVDEIIQYLDNIIGNEKINKNLEINSGNILLDSILNFKLQEVLNNNIKLKYNIIVPCDLKIDALDLVSLLGNLIDNVIEASVKINNIEDRYFNIIIKYIDNNLLINLENSFKEIKVDKNNNLKTLKKETAKHGLGLKSIEQIVNKYDGIMKIDIKDNIFKTKIVLILNN